jgi:L-serine dehydratase
MNVFPSIFNDVIGPVMRGPSSSHCAAAVRIGLLARALMDNHIQAVLVEFDKSGSLPTTYKSQGSDMGLCGGLLGLEPSDERMLHYRDAMRRAGIQIEYKVGAYGDAHPNTYRLTLKNPKESHRLVALSTGGGMIEITEIDGHGLSMQGDLYETLVYFEKGEKDLVRKLAATLSGEYGIQVLKGSRQEKSFLRIQSRTPADKGQIEAVALKSGAVAVKILPPVLPILTPGRMAVPFGTCEQMLAYNRTRQMNMAQLAVEYESARGGVGRDEIIDKMVAIVKTMQASVQRGLAGTEFRDRILGCQSKLYAAKQKSDQLLNLGILNRIVLYVTALMEAKSAMEVIVAAPTAGSCGGLPGAILGAAAEIGKDEQAIAGALLAAGMIGVFISKSSTFAAEVAGCQAECGAGSGMAAAGLVTLMGGAAEIAVAAASMALQNSLGMICDPVANRVEVPCLGKNVMAASNAVTCANMALAGYNPVIPLDEVIRTMDDVGKKIPCELRCTALGGLSVTGTSRKIQEKLEQGKKSCGTVNYGNLII